MSRLADAVSTTLGRPVEAACIAHYVGWLEQEWIRRQFKGPLLLARSVADTFSRGETKNARGELAAAGFPEFAVLAVTEAGLHVLSATTTPFKTIPGRQVALLAPGTFGAKCTTLKFTALLGLELPNGRRATFEVNKGMVTPWPQIPLIDAAIRIGQTRAAAVE